MTEVSEENRNSCLIVIDKADIEFLEFARLIEQDIQFDNRASATILSITNSQNPEITKAAQHFFQDPILLHGHTEFLKREQEYLSLLRSWSEALLKIGKGSSSIKYSRLLEQNFSHPFFVSLRKLHTIVKVIEEYKPDKLIYLGGAALAIVVENYAKISELSVLTAPKVGSSDDVMLRSKAALKGLALFVSNLSAEMFVLARYRLLRRTNRYQTSIDASVLCYAGFPANWTESEGQLTYRYLGKFNEPPQVASFKNGKLGFLISLLRRNTDRLQEIRPLLGAFFSVDRLRGATNYVVLESYGSFRALLKTYCSLIITRDWTKFWNRADVDGQFQWFGVSLKPLLWDIRFGNVREIPKNCYSEICSREATRVLNLDALVIPIYELLEGRAITAGARRSGLNTIGIQHGVHYSLQEPRIYSGFWIHNQDPRVDMMPDVICVESRAIRNRFVSCGVPQKRVQVTGSLRIEAIEKKYALPRDSRLHESHPLVVYGDQYTSRYLVDVAVALSEIRPVLLKLHPGFVGNLGPERNELLNKSKVVKLDPKIDLKSVLNTHSPLAAICSVSGVILELLAAGLPIILVPSDEFATRFQMGVAEDLIPSRSGLTEIEREVEMLHDRDYWHSRVLSGNNALSWHVDCYDDESALKLASLVSARTECATLM